MAWSEEATAALAGDKPLRLWNASGRGPLRATLEAMDLDLAPAARAEVAYRAVLAPHTATPLALAASDAPLTLELPAGAAVFSRVPDGQGLALYAASKPLSAVFHGALAKDAPISVLNFSDRPSPVFIGRAPTPREQISDSRVLKRFFGAAGEIVLPVEGGAAPSSMRSAATRASFRATGKPRAC